MKIIPCEQYRPEWWEARRGIPTASQFHRFMTPKTNKFGAGAESYILELIAAKMRPEAAFLTDRPMTRDMEHGAAMEGEARKFYAMEKGVDVQQVGFCLSDCGRYGGSPDGLVGEDGGLELKCPQVKTHVGYLIDGKLPDEYKAQVHGLLLITGRPWWDFMSYVGLDIDPVIIRVVPDEYTRALKVALYQFLEKLDNTVKKLVDRAERPS